jgi:N-acylglucosamine 2-epimerase (GlcNAc 2-epimerase)
MARAAACVELFDRALADGATGTVRELFDADWRSIQPAGRNSVEPGHQMEWVWLLREWQRLSGVDERGASPHRARHHLRDRPRQGQVRGVVREDGEIVSNASRLWQQTRPYAPSAAKIPPERLGPAWFRSSPRICSNAFCRNTSMADGSIKSTKKEGRRSTTCRPARSIIWLAPSLTAKPLVAAKDFNTYRYLSRLLSRPLTKATKAPSSARESGLQQFIPIYLHEILIASPACAPEC